MAPMTTPERHKLMNQARKAINDPKTPPGHRKKLRGALNDLQKVQAHQNQKAAQAAPTLQSEAAKVYPAMEQQDLMEEAAGIPKA